MGYNFRWIAKEMANCFAMEYNFRWTVKALVNCFAMEPNRCLSVRAVNCRCRVATGNSHSAESEPACCCFLVLNKLDCRYFSGYLPEARLLYYFVYCPKAVCFCILAMYIPVLIADGYTQVQYMFVYCARYLHYSCSLR